MAREQLWVFFRKHRQAGWQIVAAIALFAAGWQSGRVMSPYWAAQPIIFNDRECSACSSSGGTPTELTELLEEGRALQSPVPPKPAVAAAQDEAIVGGLFVGSVNSDKYHHRDCSTWSRIKEENQIWWGSAAEAEAAGYTPTKCTEELLQ